jgi:hypothetical protein
MKTKVISVFFISLFFISCARLVNPAIKDTSPLIPTLTQTLTPANVVATPIFKSWNWSNALAVFNDMVILSDSEVWAVGQHGLIIHDKPKIMHLSTSYDYPGKYDFAGDGYLSAIDFVSSNDGWLTGYGGQIFHWDGEEWSTSVPFDFENPKLIDIEFFDENNGWAVGCYQEKSDVIAAIMNWDGFSWQKNSLSDEIKTGYCFTDIDIDSDGNVWVVGENYPEGILLHWDGIVWQQIPTHPNMKSGTSVSSVDRSNIWILSGNNVFYWNGIIWTDTEIPVYFDYSEGIASPTILAISKDNVWVGGRALFHWDGERWKDTQYDREYGYIVDIELSPEGNIWALTLTGTILKLLDK